MIIDFELLRILAILEGHFHNFWNISFSTCKTIVSLDKVQDFDIFLEKIFLKGFVRMYIKGTHIPFSKNYFTVNH